MHWVQGLLRAQRKSVVKRVLQPQTPAINAHIEDALDRFRRHRKSVEKEAQVCHMIEEKESRDMVLRNNALAEAKERGELGYTFPPTPFECHKYSSSFY
jgi:hypothetical protein